MLSLSTDLLLAYLPEVAKVLPTYYLDVLLSYYCLLDDGAGIREAFVLGDERERPLDELATHCGPSLFEPGTRIGVRIGALTPCSPRSCSVRRVACHLSAACADATARSHGQGCRSAWRHAGIRPGHDDERWVPPF